MNIARAEMSAWNLKMLISQEIIMIIYMIYETPQKSIPAIVEFSLFKVLLHGGELNFLRTCACFNNVTVNPCKRFHLIWVGWLARSTPSFKK